MEARQLMARQEGAPITNNSFCEQLVEKWQPMLEGIERELPPMGRPGDGDYVKTIAAFMLEAQARSLRNLSEETRALSVGPFMKFVFPIIRRSAVRLVATQIASVQPMTGPIGGIAFYKPKYTSAKGGIAAGDEINKKFNRWYSSDYIDGELVFTGNGSATTATVTLSWLPATSGSFKVVDAAGTEIGNDGTTSGTITPVGAILSGSNIVNYVTGSYTITFASAPVTGAKFYVRYNYDSELNSSIPQVQLDITLQEIKAESRKLKSLASVEAADDLRSMWGRDIDADLVATMADEMTAEIDREIVGTALGAVETMATVAWDRATPSGVTDGDHIKSLVIAMTNASQKIHRRTQRSGANWAVTSTEVAALLMNIDSFQSLDDGNVFQGGIVKSGVLARSWQIFIDPLFPANKVLMGYQGPSILDTGIIYSPYIPMEITPNFYDPNDLSIRRAVRTRHKVSLVRPEFFSLVNVTNL